MEKIKILIVEDEFIIAESLQMMVESAGYLVAAHYTSGLETIKNFYPGMADIVMMDIHLAGKTNGVDTAIELRKISDAPIIFITNNQDETLRKKAINDTNAVYYLSKPFNKTDVSAAIELAEKSLKNMSQQPGWKEAAYIDDCIFVKNGLAFKKIMIADILFLKADGAYCNLVVKNHRFTYSENLSFFEEKFAFAKQMIRIHRSYIVNINFINKIHENRLWIDEEEIPIGKTYRNVLKEKFRFIS
jgi:DNA-binding LytR/AlgR family response regulator